MSTDRLKTGRGAGPRLVRQSTLARNLGVTDKRIATWRTRSDVNGFPDPIACHFGPTTKGGKRRHYLWDLDEVKRWFANYDERAQRARGGYRQKGRKYANRPSARPPKVTTSPPAVKAATKHQTTARTTDVLARARKAR